ncbi:MAG TPA: substrate-binding domain-containing protein [Anaerolineales bacterium]|nr:substrate-binding domain-containing protein [Anaerolineales bacterium]
MKNILSLLLASALLFGCTSQPSNSTLILATTTSTLDSGLLDVLIPLFEAESGYTVQTVAVGTGQALKMGEEGNADVLLVHAPKSEEEFMANGFGKERAAVMHNDFVVVGPADDPAEIRGLTSATEALKRIYKSSAVFISRGDDSGTHKKELSLWGEAELEPQGQAWYLETGQGMGATLIVASEKNAYALTDRGTYLATRQNLKLDILLEGDPPLLNPYHVMTVNPDKWPNVNYQGALAFYNFMISPEIQKIIAAFGVDKYGQPLFFPDAE